jgi:hypothetical protein
MKNKREQIKISKSKHSPYVRHEGKIYVEAKYSGIPMIAFMTDGLTLTHFGRSLTPHLLLEDAIKWHKKEIEVTKGRWTDTGVKTLTEAQTKLLEVPTSKKSCSHCGEDLKPGEHELCAECEDKFDEETAKD